MDKIQKVEVAVLVDTDAIVKSARLVMGDALPNSATLERNLNESIQLAIKLNVPHVVSVEYVDHSDC